MYPQEEAYLKKSLTCSAALRRQASGFTNRPKQKKQDSETPR